VPGRDGTHGREEVIELPIGKMTPHVIGRPVFNIPHTGQVMFDDFAIKRGSMELLSAWSAIEIASDRGMPGWPPHPSSIAA
jgi:galactonate dehydratase